jgi:aminopeptidase
MVMEQQYLEAYAKVLVHAALNSTKGVLPGQTVIIMAPEDAKPLVFALQKEILLAQAHPIIVYTPQGALAAFFADANAQQIAFYPKWYYQGIVKQADHLCIIRSEVNKQELAHIDPKKLLARQVAFKPYMQARQKKELDGKLTWTLANYPTPGMAKEANLTLHAYTQQIIKACFLDQPEPVTSWKNVQSTLTKTREALNKLSLESLEVKAHDYTLHIKLDENRKWLGGSGRNVPSFELFISPDCTGTQGTFFADMPLYFQGNLIQDIKLEFKDGKVVHASAKKGEPILKEMLAQTNANMLGEFSLTDKRLSNITVPMADTLFDENFGGSYGNTHIALGNAYKDSYPGNIKEVSKKTWKLLGYNESPIHTDIISTTNRTVVAHAKDGTKKIIYQDGMFLV